MIFLLFGTPLLATVVCLALSRRLPARTHGLISCAALLISCAALLTRWAQGLPAATPPLRWASLATTVIELQLRVDALHAPLLAVLYAGGALTLGVLALAFARTTSGYGGLCAALLLAVSGVALGLLSADPLLLPLGWGIATLAIERAVRLVAEAEGQHALPGGAIAGLLATLLLLTALLTGALSPEGTVAIGDRSLGIAALLLAVVAAFGLPPLHATVGTAATAPAGIAALAVGLGLPLLGGAALLRLGEAPPPAPWPLLMVLLGLVALALCSAAALGQSSLRQMLGWQVSGQGASILIAVGLGAQQAALALLLNAALLALAGFLALALLERRSGQDAAAGLPRLPLPLPLAGLAFGVAALAALGLPPTLGFWGRFWLIEALAPRYPWAIPLLIAGTALGTLAWLVPLVAFWRGTPPSAEAATAPRRADEVLPLIPAAALLLLGIRPGLLLGPTAGTAPPAALQAFLALLALALAGLALRVRALPPTVQRADERAAPEPPLGLAASLRWLGLLANPTPAAQALWSGLLLLGNGLRRALAIVEQRYYLAGILLALVSTLLLMSL